MAWQWTALFNRKPKEIMDELIIPGSDWGFSHLQHNGTATAAIDAVYSQLPHFHIEHTTECGFLPFVVLICHE